MNRIGIYYAYWTRNWDADFVPYVEKVAGLGFDILEVNAGTVTRMDKGARDCLKNAAADAGIELTYCIGFPKEYDIASEDKTTRERGMQFLRDHAKMMQYMGGKQLGGIIYSYWPGTLPEGETDRRPYWDRSVASMREAVKTAEDCGVFFNVEVVNRFEQYLLNTSAEAVAYCEQVDSPHCRVMLDTFHLNIEEDSIHDAIVTAGSRLGHFHIGETNRRAPGRGRIPWDEVMGALKAIDYSGGIVMEPFLMPGGEVGRDIKIYRDLSVGVDLDAEAKFALDFVRAQVAAT